MTTPPPKPSPQPRPEIEPEYHTGEYPAVNVDFETKLLVDDRTKAALKSLKHLLDVRLLAGAAFAVVLAIGGTVAGYKAFRSEAREAGAEEAKAIGATLSAHISEEAAARARLERAQYETQVDLRALYRSNLHGKRERRLELAPELPPRLDGGSP